MKLNNRFIFGLLSLLLAAVTAFVALPVIARQTNGKTEIVRVTAPILKGDPVTADNTETVEVGSYNLPSGTARSLDDVNGLYATADLFPGDYILPAKVSAVPVSSDTALNSIPSGQVAISLTIQTLAAGLSDKLQPGDIIRIYHFLDVAMEVPELRFVRVLSVTDADGVNVDNTREPLEDEEKQQSATITVLASPEQACLITALENDGIAHVALVSRGNEKLAEELLAEQEHTLQEIYFPETLLPEEETEENGDGTDTDASTADGTTDSGETATSGESSPESDSRDAEPDNHSGDSTNANGGNAPGSNNENDSNGTNADSPNKTGGATVGTTGSAPDGDGSPTDNTPANSSGNGSRT